jgi:putative transposase
VSERRACRLAPIERSRYRYVSCAAPQTALRIRLRELAAGRIRFGYRRLAVLLRREGWAVNAKRIYRLYRQEGLEVRMRKRKKVASRVRVMVPPARGPNPPWSMDFVTDRLVEGRAFRVLTVVDQFSGECPVLEPDFSLTGEKVAACRKSSPWTTVRSSTARRWTLGHIAMECSWNSSGLGSRRRTAISRVSTAG